MREVVLKLVIAAMLFVTIEGTIETVDEISFHQTHHAHDDSNAQWFPDSDGSDHSGEACEHFCHVHVVTLASELAVPILARSNGLLHTPPSYAAHRATSPPTPPPNI